MYLKHLLLKWSYTHLHISAAVFQNSLLAADLLQLVFFQGLFLGHLDWLSQDGMTSVYAQHFNHLRIAEIVTRSCAYRKHGATSCMPPAGLSFTGMAMHRYCVHPRAGVPLMCVKNTRLHRHCHSLASECGSLISPCVRLWAHNRLVILGYSGCVCAAMSK